MRTKSLMPIDELNKLHSYLISLSTSEKKVDVEEIEDSVLDLLIMSYAFGCDSVNEDLDTSVEVDVNDMNRVIFTKIKEKTFEDRIRQYASKKAENDENTKVRIDVESIMRVAETECHRVYCESQMISAKKTNLDLKKTWITMLDEKVRDTHEFLENVTIGIDEKFYTFDGDSALNPGGFGNAENNINCRCETVFSL